MKYLYRLLILAVIAGSGFGIWMITADMRADESANEVVPLFKVDKGEIFVSVVESGTLESSDNATVKCKVEAILGTTSSMGGGQPMTGGGMRGGSGGSMRGGISGGSGGGMSSGGMRGSSGGMSSGSSRGGGSTMGGSMGGADASGGSSGGAMAGGGATMGGAGGGAMGGGGSRGGGTGGGAPVVRMPTLMRPRIRSFNYNVPNYVSSLRAVGGSTGSSRGGSSRGGGMMGGGGGGGMRGGGGGGGGGMRGGGGGGGGMMGGGSSGSTTIIKIMPEGQTVKVGDLVAELDSANFRTELESQKIRVTGVKSDLEQVTKTLESAQISLEEFRDGVYPQDKMLLNQYISQVELRANQSAKTLEWSAVQVKKGIRSVNQLQADEFDHNKNKIMLEEAMGMKERLEKFTAPKILKELQARIEAVRTDYFAIKNAYQLEIDRQKKIETMIENCKLFAPRDGIVVYANESNMWGRTEAQIQEGASVREGQAVFKVPNPTRMLVKAQINESKISYIRTGQKTQILIDAFPNKPLIGTVSAVTAIPAPPKGFSTDIRAYIATVNIDTGGFDGLRPGMAAEVSFDVTSKADSTRIPVDSVMFVNGRGFVAVSAEKNSFTWQPVEIGLMSEQYAEVLGGLLPGQQIAMSPSRLKIPLPDLAKYPVAEKKPDDLSHVTIAAPVEVPPDDEPAAIGKEPKNQAIEPRPPVVPNPDDN